MTAVTAGKPTPACGVGGMQFPAAQPERVWRGVLGALSSNYINDLRGGAVFFARRCLVFRPSASSLSELAA